MSDFAVRDRPRARHRGHRVRRRERRPASLERGAAVRVRAARLVAHEREGLLVELVEGDLRDADAVRRAVRGCRRVFHVAADYRLWARDPRELYATNVLGTVHGRRACLAEGVERVVHTSTVGPSGSPTSPPRRDEGAARARAAHEPLQAVGVEAERAALSYVARGSRSSW